MAASVQGNLLVDQAVDQVDRDRLISLTIDLTNIPSPTGEEGEIARAYLDTLSDAGLTTTLQAIGDDRYNAVGILEGQGGGKSLMFNGHLDTSFGNDFADRGPGFKTEGQLLDDQWIFGMGTFNMKSSLAAYIVAVEAIRAVGIQLGGDLIIAGVAGEIEKAPVEDFDGPNYQGYGVGSKHLVTHGGVAEACIIGEPTNMKLVAAHCGSSWVKINIPGKLVHTAWSDPKDNAILKSRKILDGIDQWTVDYQNRNSIGNFSPKVNVAAIDGGWAWRGARAPDSCSIYIDIRTLPEVMPIQILKEIRSVVNEINSENPDISATTKLYVSNPGTSIPDDHDLVRHINAAHSAELGHPAELSMEVWCSDAMHINRYGVPSVNYGAAGRIREGGEGWSTQQGEHVHIGDLVDITKVYVRVILAWCGIAT